MIKSISRRGAIATSLAATCIAAGCATHAANESTANQAVVREFVAAYEALDKDRLMSIMDDEIYFEDPTMHLKAQGRDELAVIFQQGADFFSEVDYSVFNQVDSPPWTVLQQRISGSFKDGSGADRRIEVQGVTLLQIEAGKITKWYDYFDVLSLQEQMR